jgi:Arc/MetJ-type ribon-helix-helix transcriptional regulator
MATRNRVITIRVSDDEYTRLRAATELRGYKNVSELARAAMESVADEQLAPHQALARRVDEHATRIAALARSLERLEAESRKIQL